jgi:hypothetical protein
MAEHVEEWLADLREIPWDGAVGRGSSQFLRWACSVTERWATERLNEFRRLRRTEITAVTAVDMGAPLGSRTEPCHTPPDLVGDVATMDTDEWIEAEAGFACRLAWWTVDTTKEPSLQRMSGAGLGAWWENPKLTLFYGALYSGVVPQAHQALAADRIAEMAADPGLPRALRALATLEYGMCILSGFGIDRDVDRGLEWVRSAAVAGSGQARAFAGRLSDHTAAATRPRSVKSRSTGWLKKRAAARTGRWRS